jgi:hypothetical protein
MFFTGRARGIWACSCLLLMGAVVGVGMGGCAATGGDKAAPTTTPATTRASTKPVDETVSVELNAQQGDFAPRARGVLRPNMKATLPVEMVRALGVMAEGRESAEPPVLVTIGDVVKYDGAFPGEKGKWDKWDKGVEELFRQQQASGAPVIYELWKEPDDKKVFKDRLDFFGAWVHTVRNVRKRFPGAVLMGPSIAKEDGGWIGEFLKVGKEYDVLPDVVGWHEDGLKHDISGHVGGVAEAFWQDGTNIKRVVVSANAAIDNRDAPGDAVIFLTQMEKSVREQAWRRITQEFGFKLTHLFTTELKPRSVYYAYRQYASLAGKGKVVKVNGSATIEGLAVYDAKGRTGKLMLGRAKSRVDGKQILGAVTLQVKGAAGVTLHVRAGRIADGGAKASDGPMPTLEEDYPLKSGEASVVLPGFVTGDAYVVEMTVRGTPPTTATSPATRPTTGPTTTPTTRPAAK